MKNILYLVLLSVSLTAAQSKYITKTGQLNFEASVPSFEEVAAKNSSTTAILNSETGEFAALALAILSYISSSSMIEELVERVCERRSILFSKISTLSYKSLLLCFCSSN